MPRKGNQVATSPNLNEMKLPELRELAKQMGLRGTSTMRKGELLATLQAARTGGEAPAGVTVRVPAAAKAASAPAATPAAESSVAAAPGNDAAPARQEAAAPEPAAAPRRREPEEEHAPMKEDEIRVTSRRVRGRRHADNDEFIEEVARKAAEEGVLEAMGASERGGRAQNDMPKRRGAHAGQSDSARDSQRESQHDSAREGRMRRGETNRGEGHGDVTGLDDILASLPEKRGENEEGEPMRRGRRLRGNDRGDRNDRSERNGDRNDRGEGRNDRGDRGEGEGGRNERNGRNDRNERNQNRRRGRGRDDERNDRNDRNDRSDRNERDMKEAEELVPVAGIVDVLDSYAFIRTSGYLPGPNDVYVSMGQIKKYGLRKGDAVHGSIRPPHEGDRRNQRQKFVPLQSIDSINGMSVEEAQNRPNFNKLTPLYPNERLKQETTSNRITGRLIDMVAPIGKGQRGLIVSPPKAGKTITLQNIANSIATNNPEVHLMVVLVDERPEEVTDMERTVQGEVISSTFDRPASDHTTVAELAIERAKRLVELGQDVVVLLDSMTRLARAYNIAAPASGRILSGGVDAQALYPPKKFFGAARNIENGGSLTIISSALVETGSKMDEVIFEEFKGTGNMELRLSRELADKRMFPAVDINASGTRREELITDSSELPIIYRLRRLLGGMEPEQAYQTIVPRLKKTPTNRDFLASLVQQN